VIDVAIVGGGISGLTAAALLSRAGKAVSVFERAGRVGGRAEPKRQARFILIWDLTPCTAVVMQLGCFVN
jgi:phytoene dehydrogenase-like protein